MSFDDGAGNREPESRSRSLTLSRIVSTVKPIKDPLLGSVTEPGALVGHDGLNPEISTSEFDLDFTEVGTVTNGIV
jgi:hypothetical protein